jgi:hypothetical protein
LTVIGSKRIGGVVALLLFIAGCCDQETLARVPSPDGKLVASVVVDNCGGLEPYYLRVDLKRSGAIVGPFGLGRVTVLDQEGADWAGLEWVGPRELLIRVQRAKVRTRLERWEDVTIRIEEETGW